MRVSWMVEYDLRFAILHECLTSSSNSLTIWIANRKGMMMLKELSRLINISGNGKSFKFLQCCRVIQLVNCLSFTETFPQIFYCMCNYPNFRRGCEHFLWTLFCDSFLITRKFQLGTYSNMCREIILQRNIHDDTVIWKKKKTIFF